MGLMEFYLIYNGFFQFYTQYSILPSFHHSNGYFRPVKILINTIYRKFLQMLNDEFRLGCRLIFRSFFFIQIIEMDQQIGSAHQISDALQSVLP